MLKTVLKSALAAGLAAGGVIAVTALPASAAKVVIVAGPGSSATCTTADTAKLSPTLKNNWNASPTDSVPAVAALPTTTFASPGPTAVAAKGTATCTGNATDGTNSAPITGIKKLTLVTDPSHPGSNPLATCSALLSGSTAQFDVSIEWQSGNSDSIANTTVTGDMLSLSLSPTGFKFSGGTATGSFAGGTSSSLSPSSPATIAEVTQAQETGAQAQADTYTSLGCEPTLKLKTNSHGTSASLKGPKGLKELTVTGGSLSVTDP